MPHRCQNCQNTIPDESDSLLEGCPECGNQSWEYIEEKTREDKTQQEARTEFIDENELPSADSAANSLQNPTGTSEEDKNVRKLQNTDVVREKLNEQYEGIKVMKEGRFEINLTQLYRGNEYVIEVGKDGAYEVRRASSSDT